MNMSMILSQISGLVILSIISWIFNTKIGEFPQSFAPSTEKKRELIQIVSVFVIGFVLNTVYWLADLPGIIIYPSYRLNISFFIILGIIIMIEFGFNNRKCKDLGLIGLSNTPRRKIVAISGILVGILWGFIQFIGGYRAAPITLVGGIIWFFSPAFIEELEFRSFYQMKLERIYDQKRSLWIQSILFGLIHIPTDFFGALWWNGGQDVLFSILTLGFQSLMGFFFGVLYIKTRSVWPSVITHFLFDFMITIIMWGI